MPSKKAKSTAKSAKAEKSKKQSTSDSLKDEATVLASAEPKKDEPKSITLGELILGLMIIGIGFFIGYKKYNSTKNQTEDAAKFYKSEAMSANLALFFNEKSYYPTVNQLKDEAWLADNAPNLAVLSDDGFNNEIGGGNYKYDVLPEGCDNGEIKCDGYKITINPSSDEEIIEQLGGSYKQSSENSSSSKPDDSGVSDSEAEGLY